MHEPDELGRYLRAKRTRAGLSQKQIANAAQMARNTVSSIESGRGLRSVAGFLDLLAACGVRKLVLTPIEERGREDEDGTEDGPEIGTVEFALSRLER